MKINECMTRDVCTISPDRTVQEAARVMAAMDIGALPVGDNDRLVGMITDRDIAVRAMSERMGCDTPVRDVMTRDIKYCFEDEDIAHVASNMGDIQVRRLPVLDRGKRLVGIVALGDLARLRAGRRTIGDTLCEVSRQGGQHNQSNLMPTARPMQ